MSRKALLEFRRDTAANWTATNPTLAAGEPGFETDTGKLKVGDGATAWAGLAYIGTASAGVTSLDTITGAVSLHAGSNISIADNSPGAGQITIAATGIVSSGCVRLFDSTLGADAASIDTGPGGIDTSYSHLLVECMARSAFAAVQAGAHFVVNNDTGTNYTRQFLLGNKAAATAGFNASVAPATGTDFNVVADTAAANVATGITLSLPNYSGTTFYKQGLIGVASSEPTNPVTSQTSFLWASTAAISRLALVCDSANLRAGSRMTIYGLV